ncbi:MAG: 30S ribosomal protein S16, partial [Holosporales bacterium]
MSVVLRLARRGTKKRPVYAVVATDSRAPRDGRFLEKLGTYNPLSEQGSVERLRVQEDRVKYW